jgi:hypothetical protein
LIAKDQNQVSYGALHFVFFSISTGLVPFLLRWHLSEQYKTFSQFLAQDFLQVMVFEHVLQIFSGKCCLLPLKDAFMVKKRLVLKFSQQGMGGLCDEDQQSCFEL